MREVAASAFFHRILEWKALRGIRSHNSRRRESISQQLHQVIYWTARGSPEGHAIEVDRLTGTALLSCKYLGSGCLPTSARLRALGLGVRPSPSAPSVEGGGGTLHNSLPSAAPPAIPSSLASGCLDARRSYAALRAAASDSFATLAISISYGFRETWTWFGGT